MNLLIADTFADSLTRLTADEQKLVKVTIYDLHSDPSAPGLQLHRVDQAKDPNFWSARVNRDVRLILHRTSSSTLVCYVDHHDDAYRWAEKRKVEVHPTTGAAQLVEVRERVEEVVVPVFVPEAAPTSTTSKPRLFGTLTQDELLGWGVPPEWITDVREATEDSFFDLADRLPAEASEALLLLATGERPPERAPVAPTVSPFEHPDAMRRFRAVRDVEELERALDYPWEKWTVFLHPAQRAEVEREQSGPARVSGSAGTGKTIVALHRAVLLARHHPESRVLLATFSEILAAALKIKLRRLIGNEPRVAERIEIHTLGKLAAHLWAKRIGGGKQPRIASREQLEQALDAAVNAVDVSGFAPGSTGTKRAQPSKAFLMAEWDDVVDAWQLASWEAYRDVRRLGRKTRLAEAQRRVLWEVFEHMRAGLAGQGLVTEAGLTHELAEHFAAGAARPFDFAIVDEAQDLSAPQLRFLGALARDRPNGLFFTGDLGQRIFQLPFSWLALGIDVRGRSRSLRVNYRTSHQIRMSADRLLGSTVTDGDGNLEERVGALSVFSGPTPAVELYDSEDEEVAAVGRWLAQRRKEGLAAAEIGVFVRSEHELPRALAAVEAAGLPAQVLDQTLAAPSECVAVSTMHLAKGLEFRAVVVMACGEDVIPSAERIAAVAEPSDIEDAYTTERHLLYVACTRAREWLLVTGIEPGSEFLEDFQ